MMTLLLLGIDSLLVAAAVGPLTRPGTRPRLAALFGLADGLGFVLGWSLHAHLSVLSSGLGRSFVLLVYGGYVLGVAALGRRRVAGWPLWLLPIAMSVDNFSAGLTSLNGSLDVLRMAGEQVLSSGALALLGLTVSAMLISRLPARARVGLAGGATVLVAALLVAT